MFFTRVSFCSVHENLQVAFCCFYLPQCRTYIATWRMPRQQRNTLDGSKQEAISLVRVHQLAYMSTWQKPNDGDFSYRRRTGADWEWTSFVHSTKSNRRRIILVSPILSHSVTIKQGVNKSPEGHTCFSTGECQRGISRTTTRLTEMHHDLVIRRSTPLGTTS